MIVVISCIGLFLAQAIIPESYGEMELMKISKGTKYRTCNEQQFSTSGVVFDKDGSLSTHVVMLAGKRTLNLKVGGYVNPYIEEELPVLKIYLDNKEIADIKIAAKKKDWLYQNLSVDFVSDKWGKQKLTFVCLGCNSDKKYFQKALIALDKWWIS